MACEAMSNFDPWRTFPPSLLAFFVEAFFFLHIWFVFAFAEWGFQELIVCVEQTKCIFFHINK